ncbi:MAG: hypothetical protein ABI868_04935 [Acidobacteriota bacterium]
MKKHFMKNLRLLIVVAAACLAVRLVEAQRYKTPRTPWGDPDLQGLWSNQTSTPLERPGALSDKATLTQQEADEREEEARQSADLPPRAGDPGTYNAVWRDPGKALTRTSLIVDPPDGRVPAPSRSPFPVIDGSQFHVDDAAPGNAPGERPRPDAGKRLVSEMMGSD